MRKLFAIVATAGLLAGCVSYQWAPGTEAAGDLGRISGQCKLAAMTGQAPGFAAASGSPQFVGAFMGASIVGGMIGAAVRENRIYNACLEAAGFIPVAAAH